MIASLQILTKFGTNVCSVYDKGYRYGFNGMERDRDITNDDYDFGARIYDGRLGRWLSLDPLMKKYPNKSPYNFCVNNPLYFLDIDGRDIVCGTHSVVKTGPSEPNCMGELATTTCSFTLLNNNGVYNLVVERTIILSSSYNEILEYNASLDSKYINEYIMTHELEHILRYEQAARSSFTFTQNVLGLNVNYTGTIDEIMNNINNNVLLVEEKKINEWYDEEKSKILDTYNKSFGENVTKVEREKAKIIKDEAKKNLEKLKEEKLNILNAEKQRVKDVLVQMVLDKSNELNEHSGTNGVVNTVNNKLSKEALKYSKDDKKIVNLSNIELGNCSNGTNN